MEVFTLQDIKKKLILFNLEGSAGQCEAYFIFLPPEEDDKLSLSSALVINVCYEQSNQPLSPLLTRNIFKKIFQYLLAGGIFSVVCDFIST